MTDDTVKQCPFCGSDAFGPYFVDQALTPTWAVGCSNDNCDAAGPNAPTIELAVKAWNRRDQAAIDAAVAAERERLTWRPIETAPKDGSWVLMAGGRCQDEHRDNSGRHVAAQWTEELNGRTGPEFGRWQFAWYDGGYYGEYGGPTHWMPLPDGPKIRSQHD